VEAVFDVNGFGLDSFFGTHDLDYDALTTIRREIMPNGKSRAFVNDTPVQVAVLRELSAHLVDVHSQHENSLLAERSFQFDVLDAFANQGLLVHAYREKWQRFKSLETAWQEWNAQQDQLARERDFMQFQWEELDRAHLDDLDQDELRKVKNHLDSLSENFADGRNPQDKGDSKRHGINTKASVSSLRKTAKQGGRKGQLAHWLANMKAGRAKK
jgi:DNA repair protein RecN (Recombination protein N)